MEVHMDLLLPSWNAMLTSGLPKGPDGGGHERNLWEFFGVLIMVSQLLSLFKIL